MAVSREPIPIDRSDKITSLQAEAITPDQIVNSAIMRIQRARALIDEALTDLGNPGLINHLPNMRKPEVLNLRDKLTLVKEYLTPGLPSTPKPRS